MDSYKTAILRILVKRYRNPIEVSSLINGFPNHFKDDVSASLLYLHRLGYVSIYHSPTGNKYVSLNVQMKREILHIVNPEISVPYQNMLLDVTNNLNNTHREAKEAIPKRERISSILSVRQSIIGAILLISAVSMWSLLIPYNHTGNSDALYNKINDLHGLGMNMPIDHLVAERNFDYMLVSDYLIGPPYNFAIIQAEYPAHISTLMHHYNSHLNVIIEQIDSRMYMNSIIKIISDDSHKYRV